MKKSRRDWSLPITPEDPRLNVVFRASPFDLRHLTPRPTCTKYHPNLRCNCNGCWLARRSRDELGLPVLTKEIGMPSCVLGEKHCGGPRCKPV